MKNTILILVLLLCTARSMAAITGPHSVCMGDTINLSDASPGTSSPWSSSNTLVATVNTATGTVYPVAPGVTTISYSLSGGGSDTYTVTVNPLPAAITGIFTICVGQSTTLGDAAPGGTWSSSSTTCATIGAATGVVTGVSAPCTSVITYTLPTGCRITQTVTVNPLPTHFAITGGGSYCVNDTCPHIGLSGSQVGVSYQLMLGLTALGSAHAGTGLALDWGPECTAGVYTIIATNTLTGCSDTMTGSVTITINPIPPKFAMTGGGSYCPGTPCPNVGLINSTAGVNYQLYCNASAIGAPIAGTGAAIDFGHECDTCIYKVVATYVTTGCKDTMLDSVVVTESPVCTITGRTHYCIGDTSTLTGCSGCTWTSSNVSIATVGSCTGIVTAIAAGTTTITYTSSAGCVSTVTITVSAIPMLTSPTFLPTICSGDTVVYTPTSNIPGTTFSWSRAAIPGILQPASSGTGSIREVLTIATTYAITVTYTITLNNNGCTSTQNVYVVDSPCITKNPCDFVSAVIIKDSDSCCYTIYLSNKYYDGYYTGFSIATQHLNIDNVAQGGIWGGITYESTHMVVFGDTSHVTYIPRDTAGHGFPLARICVSGIGPDTATLTWLGPLQSHDTCVKQVVLFGCGIPVDTNCAGIINQKAVCNGGVVSLQFQVVNKSGFTMRGITLYTTDPNVRPVDNFVPIADLAPGATSPVYSVPLVVKNNATNGCFYFAACDLHVKPGTGGQYPLYCCLDSIRYCFTIPTCNGCDAISLTSVKPDPVNCCYKLTLTNDYYAATIKCLRFNGLSGTQFAILSGWSIQDPVSASQVTICAPGGSVDTGISTDFVDFCITGASNPPYAISVDFLDDSGKVVCTKELQFDSCKPVGPTCATIVDDSLYCDGSRTLFSFNVKNNSPFKLYQFDMRLSDTSFKLDKYFIVPNPPIPVGATAGPYVIMVDSSLPAIENFCLYLTGHNNVYTDSTAATECCTDSMAVACVPMMSCAAGEQCCQFSKLSIPNGITPNNDGIDDNFVIGNSAICTNINLKVYNRWGNIVFKQDHYNNTWGGKNSGGQLLPQGTYFVVLKLATGDEKAFYIDIRY